MNLERKRDLQSIGILIDKKFAGKSWQLAMQSMPRVMSLQLRQLSDPKVRSATLQNIHAAIDHLAVKQYGISPDRPELAKELSIEGTVEEIPADVRQISEELNEALQAQFGLDSVLNVCINVFVEAAQYLPRIERPRLFRWLHFTLDLTSWEDSSGTSRWS
jgi:hypothetical protein